MARFRCPHDAFTQCAVDRRARRAANGGILALGQPVKVAPRQVHVSGDLALMIVDLVVEVIDNPFGVGTP